MGRWLQTSNGLPGSWEPQDLRPGGQRWLWAVWIEDTQPHGGPPGALWEGPYFWKKAWSRQNSEMHWWHWEVNEGRWSRGGSIFEVQPPGYNAALDEPGGQSWQHTHAPTNWRWRTFWGGWRPRGTPY